MFWRIHLWKLVKLLWIISIRAGCSWKGRFIGKLVLHFGIILPEPFKLRLNSLFLLFRLCMWGHLFLLARPARKEKDFDVVFRDEHHRNVPGYLWPKDTCQEIWVLLKWTLPHQEFREHYTLFGDGSRCLQERQLYRAFVIWSLSSVLRMLSFLLLQPKHSTSFRYPFYFGSGYVSSVLLGCAWISSMAFPKRWAKEQRCDQCAELHSLVQR